MKSPSQAAAKKVDAEQRMLRWAWKSRPLQVIVKSLYFPESSSDDVRMACACRWMSDIVCCLLEAGGKSWGLRIFGQVRVDVSLSM